MKIFAAIILFLFSISFSRGQTFIASPSDFIEATYDVNDCASDYIYVNNFSSSSIDLNYQTIINTIDPIGWSNVLCTSLGCTPYVPSSGTLGTILPGSNGYFHLQVCFLGLPGTGEIKFRVYESGNPSNSDTITFRYHAAIMTGLSDVSQTENLLFQNYPNPVTGTTIIKYSLVKPDCKLIVSDILGKTLFEYTLNNITGELIFDENLISGIYFYSLFTEDNKMIDHKKMIVR
jgi:hypothetical protein